MSLDIFLWGSVVVFLAYWIWYVFMAKTEQSLSQDELFVTWKLHKQQTRCTALRFQNLLTNKNKNIVGFKCECGYEFRQKRLIAQKILRKEVTLQPNDQTTLALEAEC